MADAAEFIDGRFTVRGIHHTIWTDRLPAIQAGVLVVVIAWNPPAPTEVKVRITLVGPDTHLEFPVELAVSIDGLDDGTSVATIIRSLQVDGMAIGYRQFGRYSWRVQIDGETITEIPVDVRQLASAGRA
jgi:hypothetical protein